MSTINEKIDKLFRDAVHSDGDLGYPDDVAFLPDDEDWADEALWRSLIEGVPTVLVGEDVELLLTPLHRGRLDRLRGQVPVSVTQRVHGYASPYVTHSRLGRHPMREMRELARA